jgi:hypothetical protein
MAEDLMMPALRHGRKLSGEQYDRAVVDLYRDGSPERSDVDLRYRERELNLTIDHRLGVDFPLVKRKALWNVHVELEKHRARTLLLTVVGGSMATVFGRAASLLVNEYAKILDPLELKAFFDLNDFDMKHVRRISRRSSRKARI